MNRKLYTAYLLLIWLFITACMDISPPRNSTELNDDLLHSLKPEFFRGVFSVGDSFQLAASGTLLTGERIDLDRSKMRYRLSLPSSEITLGEDGWVFINALRTTETVAYIDYTVGELTKSTSVYIYVTDESYEISHISITPMDSARGGQVYTLHDIAPRYRAVAYDIHGNSINSIDLLKVLTPFITEAASGKRIKSSSPRFNHDISDDPGVLWISKSDYFWEPVWIGLEGVLWGTYVLDSAEFRNQTPAVTAVQLRISLADFSLFWKDDLAVSSCGFFLIENNLPVELEIEFSKPTNQIACGGEISESESLIVPASGRAFRKLALPPGDSISWNVTRVTPDIGFGFPQIESTIYILDADPNRND